MSKLSALLSKRMKSSPGKVDMLAKLSSTGELSSFSGVFRIAPLTDAEKEELKSILEQFRSTDEEVEQDLETLTQITSEVKAINNQAIILHGERIKKAQALLKDYREGAFSAWLMVSYSNRQTPYNFLQYFEFYTSLNAELQRQIDAMPRQVIYTLASRVADEMEKKQFIENYAGQSKQELLAMIRMQFPLDEEDKRKEKPAEKVMKLLNSALQLAEKRSFKPSSEERAALASALDQIRVLLLRG